ncbi:MAG: sigma-70 family RNA polymerase sigma factor [Prosthecobacter sp.]|uniref:RNA polymerase sigma factor n=1 Tax=Prosthecobacter sp. TaxID=1965333 RepID=UPI003BAFE137
MPASPSHSPLFATTRWSVVLAAKHQDSQQAMETLCRAYWYPLYAYVRRDGHTPHDAQDLTQEFFARLVEKDWLRAAGPEHGRFRTFLLVAMKRFLINEWHKSSSQKRGGHITHVPLDAEDAERRFASEPDLAPDAMFERRWAMTLLEQTLNSLEAEFAASSKAGDFQALKHCLTLDRGSISYPELAAQIGCSEGAARVAVHRMRKRFRELFRTSIASTLAEGEDVDMELQHVVAVLSSV